MSGRRGFRDTLPWWHTTWVWPYGYWRPLSALAFWLEYRAFGEHFNDWFATLIVSHVLFCACLSWFAYSLTTRWTVAILSATIFAAPRPVQLTALEWLPGYGSQVPGDVILDYWKNNVEAWLGIVVLLALVAAVQRRYSLAFALAGLSVCFKETGWLTFPLIVMVAAAIGRGGIRGIPPRAWLVAAAVAAPLAAIKIWVGGHMLRSGSNFTSNGAWPHRYLSQIDGFGLGGFTNLSWPTALLGLAIMATGIGARRLGLLKSAATVIAAILLCTLAQSALLRASPAVSLVMLLDPSLGLVPALQSAFYFTITYLVLRNRASHRLLGLLIAAFCLESTIVIVNPKQTAHIYYIPSALCAVLLSVAFAAAWDTLLNRRARPNKSDQSIDARIR